MSVYLLLRELRTSDEAGIVADRLRWHYTYLVLDAAHAAAERYRREVAELTGPLWLGLARAIDRLARNDVPTAQVDRFILDEMERGRRRYGRELSENIIPPASTNAMRRKAGLPPYPALKRERPSLEPMRDRYTGELIEPDGFLGAERPSTTHLISGKNGQYYIPSKVFHGMLDDSWVARDLIALTEQEHEVLDLMTAGYSQRDIAKALRISPHIVRGVIERMRERALEHGLASRPNEHKAKATGDGAA